jgi:hypothetical protein
MTKIKIVTNMAKKENSEKRKCMCLWTNVHTKLEKTQDMNHENKLGRNQNRIKVIIISSLLNSIKNLGN